MSSPTPRRRPSPAVYRRRRIVALLLALIVIGGIVAGVWALIAQPWNSDPAVSPSVTPTASSSPTPTPTPTATADAEVPAPDESQAPEEGESEEAVAAACNSGNVSVEGVVSQDSYAADQNPEFSISLTNTSDADCTINVGTSAQSFTVTSGADTWWRSTDCQTEPSDMVITLAAGQSVASATPLMWDRTRSSVDTCDSADRERAPAGGASYHLAVEIGGIGGIGTTQFLLY